MHPYASVCIRMHSYASVTPLYAPICFHKLPLRIKMSVLNTHVRRKVKKEQTHTNHKIIIAIGSVESVRIQPNMPKYELLLGSLRTTPSRIVAQKRPVRSAVNSQSQTAPSAWRISCVCLHVFRQVPSNKLTEESIKFAWPPYWLPKCAVKYVVISALS